MATDIATTKVRSTRENEEVLKQGWKCVQRLITPVSTSMMAELHSPAQVPGLN